MIELDPEDPDIWLDLSVVYADRKDYSTALDTLEEGLKWHESNADFYYGMAYYHLMNGQSNQANTVLVTALDMDYEGYKRLFMTFPEAKNHPAVVNMIESYRKD